MKLSASVALIVAAWAAAPGQLVAQTSATDAKADGRPIVVAGTLDEAYGRSVREAIGHRRSLMVSSIGGDPRVALGLVDDILRSRPSMIFASACLSACAEVLLPAAIRSGGRVSAQEALIGYHHNSSIARIVSRGSMAAMANFERCFAALDREFSATRAKLALPANGERMQAKMLGARLVNGDGKGDCRRYRVETRVKFWFPDTAQFSSLFGLTVPGSVCADSRACVGRFLRLVAKDGERYLVGAREFVVRRNGGAFSLDAVHSEER